LEQGRIQGALFSLQALASGIGPVFLRYIYRHSKESKLGPGSMFVVAGCLYLVAVACACALPKDKANSKKEGGENVGFIAIPTSDGENVGFIDIPTSDSSSLSNKSDTSYGSLPEDP
jgi:hypothetical protein